MKERRIVVIQSGWVLAGEFTQHPDHIELTFASVVQRWGTTKGIGQLALDGPTVSSVIHPIGKATVPLRSVLYSMPMSKEAVEKWPL